MKKSILFFVALAGFTAMSSCESKTVTTLENAADSASYALGVSNGARLGDAMKSGMYEQLKDIKTDEFMKGFAAALKTDSTQRSYELGLGQGLYAKEMLKNIKQGTGLDIDIATFIRAYKDALAGDSTLLISPMNANHVLDSIFRAAAEAKEKAELDRLAASPEAKENLAKGNAFLVEKAKEEGVVKTESGLLYKVVKEGQGEKVQKNQRVKVAYKGSLIDGTQFDANSGAIFSPMGVVPGFGEGLLQMQKGGKYILYIPAELGYGVRGGGDKIPTNSTLVFEVEVLDILK
ncbi:MAG TPA: FKBP-type peptidyl-prolyl cis-trans isomerase [Candidatus Barnesiella merdipullorum]|nr:FKBP-type peptidyl-prolyl cis-trans isomerase [Candidatus Barnesiella merdipullorum]